MDNVALIYLLMCLKITDIVCWKRERLSHCLDNRKGAPQLLPDAKKLYLYELFCAGFI